MLTEITLSYRETKPHNNIWKHTSKEKSHSQDMILWKSTFNFDLEIKGQGYFEIMNTHEIILWWYNHIPNMVCQWRRTKKLRARHESAQTDRHTHTQSDSYLPTDLCPCRVINILVQDNQLLIYTSKQFNQPQTFSDN